MTMLFFGRPDHAILWKNQQIFGNLGKIIIFYLRINFTLDEFF